MSQADMVDESGLFGWTYAGPKIIGPGKLALVGTPFEGGTVRNIILTCYVEEKLMTLSLYQDSWAFSAGVEMPIEIRFDDGEPANLSALGNGKQLILTMHLESAPSLIYCFAMSAVMRISFPGSREEAWEVDLFNAIGPARLLIERLANPKKRQEA